MQTLVSHIPWRESTSLDPALFARIRRRAIFECCKWDPQIGDVSVLAHFPLILERSAWQELSRLAESLAAEAEAAESELLDRPDLHRALGIPFAIRRVLRRAASRGRSEGAARVVRFDFHWTAEGWRISEANSDVPGGFGEAGGFTALMSEQYPACGMAGDPAEALGLAVADRAGNGAAVAFVHATAYSDDRQVMEYFARQWTRRGLRAFPVSPEHLRWEDGRARIDSVWHRGPVDFIVRFFPAEWLPNLSRASQWAHFFVGGRTPACNPGAALLTQSKRFPLVWDRLATPLPTWRRLLPQTVDPRAATGAAEDWVLKPALGRVGEDIAIEGVTAPKESEKIRRAARKYPGDWAAQRRFDPVAWVHEGQSYYPCIGVYTVDRRAAGAYARIAPRRLIDSRAMEAAVLIHNNGALGG